MDGDMRAALRRLRSDDGGATAIEYGLIAAMIAVVIISIAGTGGAVQAIYETFGQVASAIASGNGG
jgi:pilus assembly protein Flp/PilA